MASDSFLRRLQTPARFYETFTDAAKQSKGGAGFFRGLQEIFP